MVKFHGEDFTVNMDLGCLEYTIREPYYVAGRDFGWEGVQLGLGVNKHAIAYAIKNNLMLRLKVGGSQSWWRADPADWLIFSNDHKSVMKKGRATLLVCQWSEPYVWKEKDIHQRTLM